MTSEQLLATRATLWRQKALPLLTLDDAKSWLLQSGLCLFLPRKAQIPAPAPSFVEACLGETNATPPRAAIESAKGLLVRLIESKEAVPLNLLGTPADHPDFLVTNEALPFVYALRGDRDWKHAPGGIAANRVSPLVTHIWEVLQRRGVLTAAEIQEELGRELTEAAILRALHELWASLRVIPLYQSADQETLWEPLQSRYQPAITSGIGMSQVTALSVLVSAYFQSVVAASSDDAESFLSPLASRSKIREVIRGLNATRQVALVQMETQSLFYVEGSLPEFPEEEKPAIAANDGARAKRPHPTSPAGLEAALKHAVTRAAAAAAPPRPPYKRPAAAPAGGNFSRSGSPWPRPDSPGAAARPSLRSRNESAASRPAASRSGFSPGKPVRPERTEPGTGLRADGTPKKPRWRDMPGGRPDQKGKPARFSAPRADVPKRTGTGEGVGAARTAGGRERPGRDPDFARKAPREGQPFRPAAGGRPAGGRSYGSSSAPRTDRPAYGARGREGAPSPARPFSPGRSSSTPGGSRAPSRSGADRSAPRSFSPRSAGGRPAPPAGRSASSSTGWAGRPARSSGAPASGSDRNFTPRPPRTGGFPASRPAAGQGKPYSSRSASSSNAKPPSAGRSASGRPSGGKTYSASGGRPRAGAGPSRAAGGTSFKTGGFAKRTQSGGLKSSGPGGGFAGRPPSFGSKAKSRPGQGGARPGTDRPRASSSQKPPAGRGPAKFTKPRSGPRPG